MLLLPSQLPLHPPPCPRELCPPSTSRQHGVHPILRDAVNHAQPFARTAAVHGVGAHGT